MMSKNKLQVVLTVSLLLNAFLLGVMVSGHFMHKPPFPPPGGPGGPGGPEMMFEKAVEAVDAAYREDVAKTVTEKFTLAKERREDMRTTFEQIEAVLSAETFDRDVFLALEEEIHAQDEAIKNSISSMMMSIASSLPDDQRVKFFNEFFKNKPPHFGKKDRQ